jgi:hypothetical protein
MSYRDQSSCDHESCLQEIVLFTRQYNVRETDTACDPGINKAQLLSCMSYGKPDNMQLEGCV